MARRINFQLRMRGLHGSGALGSGRSFLHTAALALGACLGSAEGVFAAGWPEIKWFCCWNVFG